MTTSSANIIKGFVNNLRSRSELDREKAALHLRDYVSKTANDSDDFSRLMSDLSVQLFEILLSRENNEVMGGIIAVEKVFIFINSFHCVFMHMIMLILIFI